MEYILKTNKITKKYGNKFAVKDVDILIRKGDIYGLVGENGAGKTTLMRMISGIALPTTGSLELFNSSDLDKGRKKVGVLIEEPAIFPNMTANENLKYFYILMGLKDKKKIEEVLETVGLNQVKKKKVKNFSLGMKQRLGIAIALLGNPELLILDEPINGLDVSGVKEIRDLLLNINENFGTTILISSHILTELSRIATRFGIIRHGVLEDQFTAEELEKRSGNLLEIKVSDIDLTNNILDKIQDIYDIKQTDDDTLRIWGGVSLAAKINRQLVEGGVEVQCLFPVKEDLESYYFNKIGGEHNDTIN